jgi:hypothetical protein
VRPWVWERRSHCPRRSSEKEEQFPLYPLSLAAATAWIAIANGEQ